MTQDNWLNTETLQCGQCGESALKVDHSPFTVCWRLYCDRCPKSVEVSFYEKAVQPIWKKISGHEGKSRLFRRLEDMLRPCDCGGTFRFDSVRRCFGCGGAIFDDTSADLYPSFAGALPDRDPTVEEQARFDESRRQFVRTENIWR